jgi:LPPG:FO 2-phospho-L-lactate transferase
MADRLMPAVGLEVTAAGVADAYVDLLSGWVIDLRDAPLAQRIEASGIRVAVTDAIIADDDDAERIARTALELVGE